MSDSLQPHGLQHSRLPCPSPAPGACSNSCPLSWWCHPIISSSVILFSSCLQSFPASGSFPVIAFFFLLTCEEVKMAKTFSVSYKVKLMWLLNYVKCGLSSQFSSVTQLCPTFCDPMDCSMPRFPLHHQLLELAQTHVHWVSDVIQLSDPLSSPSPPALNLSQHRGLFQGVSSSHQVAKVLEFQLQH